MKPNLGLRIARGYFKSILARNLGECWYTRNIRNGFKRSSLYTVIKIRKGSN